MKTHRQHHHRLWAYIKPFWKMLTMALLGRVLLALSLLILPALMMQFVDSISADKHPKAMAQMLQIIIFLLVFRGVISHLSNYAINTVINQVSKQIHQDLFNKIFTLSLTSQSDLTRDKLTTCFISNLNQFRQASSKVATILTKDFILVTGLIAWMFHLNSALSLLALFATILITIIIQLVNDKLSHSNQKICNLTGDTIKSLVATIRNYKLIKLDGGQLYESKKFMARIKQTHRFNLKQSTVKILSVILLQTVGVIVLMAIIILTSQQLQDHQITPGEISAFVLAALMLVFPLRQILLLQGYWQQGEQALKTIFSFLDQKADTETGTTWIKHFRGELMFDNVSLCNNAQTQPVLRNLNFTIKPGEIVAFTGATEQCKTALIDLILGFQSPTNGDLFFDGHNLKNINLTELYTRIALIPQKPILRQDTVAANIAYGALQNANEVEITAAAQAAHATTFIREMPQGLQTIIGKNETTLTDEQCLHIAIAHALLKNPSLLILDQVFTTADAESDNLKEALKTLMQGRTTLIITQQPYLNLKQVDRVIKLKDGFATEV